MAFWEDWERTELRAQHRLERDGRIRDRIKAVLLYDKAWTFVEIADALLLSEGAIRQHISQYQITKKLEPKSLGSREKLSLWQSEQLKYHLEEHVFLYVRDIAFYIKSLWGISYAVTDLTQWLKRNGFSYLMTSNPPSSDSLKLCQVWIQDQYLERSSDLGSATTLEL